MRNVGIEAQVLEVVDHDARLVHTTMYIEVD
jgi:hypothetical protein